LEEIISNVISSPLSYLLAFIGAFIWAAYCTVTAKYVSSLMLTGQLKTIGGCGVARNFSHSVSAVNRTNRVGGARSGLRRVERGDPPR
jgi:hypothetical protein